MSPKEYLELLSITIVYSGLIFLNTNLFNIGIFSSKKGKILFYILLLLVAIITVFLLPIISTFLNNTLARDKYIVL